MDHINSVYNKLADVFEQYYFLKRNLSLLNWDSAVYMPIGSIDIRKKQISAQNTAISNLLDSAKVKKYLKILDNEIDNLDDDKKINFKEIKKIYFLHECIPLKLQNKLAEQTAKTEVIWREAHNKNNYDLVYRDLDKIIELVIEKSKILSDTFQVDAYTGLMQEYDYCVSDQEVSILFNTIKNGSNDIIKLLEPEDNAKVKNSKAGFDLNVDLQKKLCLEIIKDFGFDYNRGRLDASAHPFTEGGKNDVRITTSYDNVRPLDSLHSVIHEFGHALYDMNLPDNCYSQPIGYDMGMMFHEAVALFYEMCIFRTEFFAQYVNKKIKKSDNKINLSLNNIQKQIFNNMPSLIRIQSGEVEYLMHIILRYNLEKMLISKQLSARDLPEAWAVQSSALLSKQPDSDKNGCLQDIHWYLGLFGYFPSYGLGQLLAVNIFVKNNIETMLTDNNYSISERIANINTILIKKLFTKGRSLSRKDLIKELTGDCELSAKTYISYLENKYS